MLGVRFAGHANLAPLLLAKEWAGPPPLADQEGTDGEVTLPVGPQHPLIKEPISIQLDVQGETVTAARIEIGYVHRGLEQLLQRRSYTQGVAIVERICGICSHAHTTAYCQGVETLLGVEVPERAQAIRALLCELERLHSHLLWLGVLAEAIGFAAIFMYSWREREHILDLMEMISGGRIRPWSQCNRRRARGSVP